jgi:hypothetical protein
MKDNKSTGFRIRLWTFLGRGHFAHHSTGRKDSITRDLNSRIQAEELRLSFRSNKIPLVLLSSWITYK